MIEELPDDIDNDELDDVEPVGDEAQLYEHFRVVVDKGQEMMRVDKYLFDRLTNSSRNRIQKAADAGFVMANGKAVKSSYKVKPMDVITVMMDRPRYENEVIPEDIPLDIVYEDKYLMVVNKPAGLVVHPGHGNCSLRQAEARILASGFKLAEIQYIPGEKDWVYGVKYKGRQLSIGEKVPAGAVLTLMVGDGGALQADSLGVDSVGGTVEPMLSEDSAADESWF